MGYILDVKPCCCGCVHFLPPWDIPAIPPAQSPFEPQIPDSLWCVHSPVCVLWQKAREGEVNGFAPPDPDGAETSRNPE